MRDRRRVYLNLTLDIALAAVLSLAAGCAPKFNFHSSLDVGSENQDTGGTGGTGPVSYQLVFTTQPSSTVASGGALPTGGVIEVEDNNGNLITTGALSTATIALSDSSGNGNIAGVTSVTASGGIATIPNNALMFEKGGTKSIAATTTVSGYGTLSTASASIDVTIPSISTVSQFSGPDDPAGDVDGTDIANGGTARMTYPWSMVEYGSTIYFSEESGNSANDPCLIRQYDTSTGEVSDWVGTIYDCNYSTGSPGSIDGPVALATDGSTYVYFTHNDAISRADFATGTVATVAGKDGHYGYTDADGTSAKFNYAGLGAGVLYLSGSSLYVADTYNCVIRLVDLTGSFAVSTYAGNGTCADSGETAGTPTTAEFNNPTALYADSDYLYVEDSGGIERIAWVSGNVDNLESTYFLAGGAAASLTINGSDIFMEVPMAIFELATSTGAYVEAAAGHEYEPGEVDGDPGTSYLGGNVNISLLSSGSDIYAADSSNDTIRVLETSSDNDLVTVAGTPSAGQGASDGTSSTATFYDPVGGVSDGTYLYTIQSDPDSSGIEIRQITLSDGTVVTHKNNAWGLNYLGSNTYEAMIGSTIYFDAPSKNQIWSVNTTSWSPAALAGNGSSGNVTGAFSTAEFSSLGPLATDGSNLYVYDNGSIKVLNLASETETETVSVLSGTPQSTGCATGSSSASQYDAVGGLAYLNGDLYVAEDCFGGGIVQVSVATGASTLYAGNGTAGYEDGSLSSAEFSLCNYTGDSCSLTSDGVALYLLDYYNGMVRKIDPTGPTVSTMWGSTTERWQVDGTVGTSGSAREGDGDTGQETLYYGYGALYVIHSRGVRIAN